MRNCRLPETTMTLRELINQKVRSRRIAFLASVVALPFVLLLGLCLEGMLPFHDIIMQGSLLGAAIIFCVVSTCRVYQRWRCPSCGERLLPHFYPGGLWDDAFKMPPALRFCPYCGQDFDEEIVS